MSYLFNTLYKLDPSDLSKIISTFHIHVSPSDTKAIKIKKILDHNPYKTRINISNRLLSNLLGRYQPFFNIVKHLVYPSITIDISKLDYSSIDNNYAKIKSYMTTYNIQSEDIHHLLQFGIEFIQLDYQHFPEKYKEFQFLFDRIQGRYRPFKDEILNIIDFDTIIDHLGKTAFIKKLDISHQDLKQQANMIMDYQMNKILDMICRNNKLDIIQKYVVDMLEIQMKENVESYSSYIRFLIQNTTDINLIKHFPGKELSTFPIPTDHSITKGKMPVHPKLISVSGGSNMDYTSRLDDLFKNNKVTIEKWSKLHLENIIADTETEDSPYSREIYNTLHGGSDMVNVIVKLGIIIICGIVGALQSNDPTPWLLTSFAIITAMMLKNDNNEPLRQQPVTRRRSRSRSPQPRRFRTTIGDRSHAMIKQEADDRAYAQRLLIEQQRLEQQRRREKQEADDRNFALQLQARQNSFAYQPQGKPGTKDPIQNNKKENTVLHDAARYGDEAAVRNIIASGKVYVDQWDKTGQQTALGWATINGYYNIAEVLLKAGARREVEDIRGWLRGTNIKWHGGRPEVAQWMEDGTLNYRWTELFDKFAGDGAGAAVVAPVVTPEPTIIVSSRSNWYTMHELTPDDFNFSTEYRDGYITLNQERNGNNCFHPNLECRSINRACINPPTLYDISKYRSERNKEIVLFHGTTMRVFLESPDFYNQAIVADNWKTISNKYNALGQGFYVTFDPNEALTYAINTSKSDWANGVGGSRKGERLLRERPYMAGVPIVLEIRLISANEFTRGGVIGGRPRLTTRNQSVAEAEDARIMGGNGDFIQNCFNPKAKEQLVFTRSAIDTFRKNFNHKMFRIHILSREAEVATRKQPTNWQHIPYFEDIFQNNETLYSYDRDHTISKTNSYQR